jgi:hypothetical protein
VGQTAAPKVTKFHYDYLAKASKLTNTNVTDLKYNPRETFFTYLESIEGPRPQIVSNKLECWPDTVARTGRRGSE